MLAELVIENYAVIERLRVRFNAGLNVLTGETGSGKSIVVDTLGLLFGGRASAEMVRTAAGRARVSAIFQIPAGGTLRRVLDDAGITLDDDELLIEREISAEGKSRGFVQSRPVTLALLRDLAAHLGDIHGQHDQQSLFSSDAQLEILDNFGQAADLLAEVGQDYRAWRSCTAELEELRRSDQDKLRLADLWAFQRREIEAAAPKPGEDAELGEERRRLQNVERLQELANAAWQALYDSPESALAQVRTAARRINELVRIDTKLSEAAELLKPAEVALQEASHAIRDYLGNLEADPARLEAVESRLSSLDRLKRKYGASIEEVLSYLEEVRGKLEALENSDARAAELEKLQTERAREYETAAARLTRLRTESARRLEKKVESELGALAMERSVFRVQLSPRDWSESGIDAVEFQISPNVGEEPKPLDRIASGGELSRVALALKTAATSRPRKCAYPRTLVFDEVDAGIGGRAAETVGRRLKLLAGSHQVLCVTHLPQIAGFADHHYVVEKRESRGRTVATIEELEGSARTREIGRMLSGERVTAEALRHAEQLIRASVGE